MKGTVICILLVNLAERFCFYTINGTQLFYMKQSLGVSNTTSNAISLVIQAACFLACLPGGICGDKFGKFRTILVFAILYVAGSAMIMYSTNPNVKSYPLFLIGSFAGLAIGSGGIKPNVPNFGADQIDDPEQQTQFFAYFYWMINIGSAIALGLMSTVTSDPAAFGIEEGWGFFVAYLIATVCMIAAAGLFLLGACFGYKGMQNSTAPPLMRPIFRTLMHSAKASVRGKAAMFGWFLLIPLFALSFAQPFVTGNIGIIVGFVCLAMAFGLIILLSWAHLDNRWVAPVEGVLPEGVGRNEVMMTFQSIPMLLIANAAFNFAYSMMLTPFVQQSCQMNLALGSLKLSGAVFNLGDCFAIIIFIPVFDQLIYPLIERVKGSPVSNRHKLLGGFVFAALAMGAAVAIEFVRRDANILTPAGLMSPSDFTHHSDKSWSCTSGPSSPCNTDSGMLMGKCVINGKDYCSPCASKSADELYGIYESDMSACWMFLPFALIGIGEIMVNPTCYYYAYTLTPAKTRSVVQAINMVFQGSLPTVMVSIFTVVLGSTAGPADLNKGHCEYLYYISLVMLAVGTIAFFGAVKKARITVPEDSGAAGSFMRENSSETITGSFAMAAFRESPTDGGLSLTDPRNLLGGADAAERSF